MSMILRVSLATGMLICVAMLAAPPAWSASKISDFYAGRTITIMVPTSMKEAAATYARLFKRYITKQIPGRPKIVLNSIPGAGGMKGAAYAYGIAPRDGTYIAQILASTLINPVLDRSNFDPAKIQWIGSMTRRPAVISVWHDSPVKSLQEAKKTTLLMGSVGSQSELYMIPKLLNALIGTKFRIIKGYKTDRSMNMAMEQGEIQGRMQYWADITADNPDWLKNNRLRFLVQFGPNIKKLLNVPSLKDLVDTEEQRQMIEFIELASHIGMAFWLAPDVPADRVRALRTAFRNAMNDSVFFAEARRRQMSVDPILGESLQAMVSEAYQTPKPLLEQLSRILATTPDDDARKPRPMF